ncbi:hypothetical protein V7103_16935, partial [Neobacillus drentensis]|uniref:hypothetical protein n=1 Tax=Neobacillus drentensis TaxID=220684 RepID=UPI0030000994
MAKKDKNENSSQNPSINVDNDTTKNLANNLLKNQSSLDLGSLMQVASSLLKNDALMNSLSERSKKKENPEIPVAKVSKNQEKAELASLSEKLENIANDISGLKQENVEQASLLQKLENIT